MRASRILLAESGADARKMNTAGLEVLCILSIRTTPSVYNALTPSHRSPGDFLFLPVMASGTFRLVAG